jgi:hypothetical protein
MDKVSFIDYIIIIIPPQSLYIIKVKYNFLGGKLPVPP